MTKLLNLFKKKRKVEDRVIGIQQGELQEREKLIQEYIPFITKIISNQLGRYIEIENDDVFSIGLMAFNESIDKYDETKGKFLTFAAVVIRNRVIDEFRRESKKASTVQLPVEGDDGYETTGLAIDSFENQMELKMDMAALVEKMKSFGVSLDDLVKDAPKHKNTRNTSIKIGKYVYQQENLREKFIQRKHLPIKELVEDLHTTKKVIQGNRKFIIAVILILDSDLDTLKRYIIHAERGEKGEI
ncbi:RNA polymerase sigma factor [Natronincola peptidivorans]|uniref:RNA polymerase sigma factor SigI n=1 Tax=Natronincola peptidivorans TaxID=426128 RepID=A0A1I0BVF0_9FIRM|nr:RNA polymerase sigma-I factor [Natronincola peptidivorans]SET11050.1 RNA polymerase sigma factor [Natronincola peptidivorans]